MEKKSAVEDLGDNRVHQRRSVHIHEGRAHLGQLKQVEPVLGHGDAYFLARAQNGHLAGIGEVAQQGGGVAFNRISVDADGRVAVAESELFGLFVEGKSVGQVLHGQDVAPPGEHDDGIEHEGREHVHQYTSHHDPETLGDALAAELIWAGGLLELFGVHALVHHAGYLHVATQGNPADAVFRLVVLEIGEQFGEPFVARAEQMELGVEEHVELLHLHAKELGEEEVAALVQNHEQAETTNKLECLDGNE